jgi:UDPglucose 6-dehydrogenase
MKIAYVGMTHLGLNSAVAAAEKGFEVVCLDPQQGLIANLKKSQLPVIEPQLPELLKKNSHRIHFTHQLSDLEQCDLIYVAPDIPTNELGQSDLKSIRSLIDWIQPVVNKNQILMILSQVPPGFTRQISKSGIPVFYQVETLIFGQAIERALHPERFIIGTADPQQPLPAKLTRFLQAFACPILPMRYESAELSKIAINMFLVSSVSTTNTLAELCEKIGADWSEIAPALQLDRRIGKFAYLSPGLGIAGGNLERDLATFSSLADLHGTDAGVVRAWQKNAHYRRNWVLRKIHQQQKKAPTIAMLGLAYKKDTSSIKNSPAIDLLSHLCHSPVRVYDPAVKALPDCYSNVEVVAHAKETYPNADLLLIMTPWDEFKSLPLNDIAKDLKGKTVIDPYGILNQKECVDLGLNYHKLGV